jgi:LysM repeat protein
MLWFKRRQVKSKRIVIRISKAAFVVRVLTFIVALQLIIIPASYAINKASNVDRLITDQALSSIEADSYVTVVVEAGDTLWDLVDEHYEGKKDIRRIIYFVKDTNEIGTTIYPGQSIKIPLG